MLCLLFEIKALHIQNELKLTCRHTTIYVSKLPPVEFLLLFSGHSSVLMYFRHEIMMRLSLTVAQ